MSNIRAGRCVILCMFVASFIIFSDRRESSETKQRRKEDFEKVVAWLKVNAPGSEKNKQAFFDAGITKLGNLCLLRVDEFQYLNGQNYWMSTSVLKYSLQKLKREEAFKYWLKQHQVDDSYGKLLNLGIDSLEKIASQLDYKQASALIKQDQQRLESFWRAVGVLKARKHLGFDDYPVGVEVSFSAKIFKFLWRVLVITAKLFWFVLGAAVIIICIFAFILTRIVARLTRSAENGQFFARLLRAFNQGAAGSFRNSPTPNVQPRQSLPRPNPSQVGFWQRLFSSIFNRASDSWVPYDARRTKFEFLWAADSAVVGEMRCFSMKFYRNLISVCPNSQIDNANVKITVSGVDVPCTIEEDGSSAFLVKFTPLISGSYKFNVYACGKHVKTHYKSFLPGPIDPTKTSLKVARSTVVMQENEAAEILLDERDKYSNLCYSSEESLTKYCFEVHEINEEMTQVNPEIRVVQRPERLAISMTFPDPGCYNLAVTYEEQPIMKNVVTAIVLNKENWKKMKSDVKNQPWNLWYEAYLLPNCESQKDHKRRKVYCYITSKALTIKEFYLKIIPKRLHTLRMRPSIKLTLLPKKHDETGFYILKIEANVGNPILVACKERSLFAATFTQMLLGNVGGFDSFENKRKHLYSELRKLYSKRSGSNATISVHRETLLRDSMKVTKNFADSDWGRTFTVTFIGEVGLDYGGLKREWFQLNCDTLFSSKNGIFQKLGKDDAQSLIHPNPFRSEEFKSLKYFEFAGKIVGKLLIDCALDNGQYIRARFSRSFLSQILGLGVSWRHFETDDKEFYKTKVNYILNNDVEDLEMTFTEDVYDHNQAFIKTVDLKPYGSQISVTNENKMKYLQLVAEYRLVNSVKDEIAAFLKGLNSLVPDRLLSIFDENELELLICGTENISVTDLQQNFTKCGGGGADFDKVLQWFWEILSVFNQEELSRLVQFTTGCSQLPPGGFKDLSPRFQIMAYPGFNALPSAHTCFNMLCLPNYSSKEEFQRLLVIALNEGSEGFGLV